MLQQQAMQQQAQQQQYANESAAVASQKQVAAIQATTSTDTWALLRQFGQRNALAGANLTTPLSNVTGGFANPPATAGGLARSA